VQVAVENRAHEDAAPESDGIADLFAALRGGEEQQEPLAEEPPAPEDEPGADLLEESVPPRQSVTPAEGADALAVRDRVLLPVQNRALRSIKRRIVDLQNRTLEELRLEGDWEPDRALFEATFADDLQTMSKESVVAGYAGAADLTGSAETPHPEIVEAPDATTGFASALAAAVGDSLEASATTEAGIRETASSVSRVFRTWRTDEAERRVRAVAFGGYHRGLLAGLRTLGVETVVGVPSGRRCASCPAELSWSTDDPPPGSTVIPPADAECVCTIAPAGPTPIPA